MKYVIANCPCLNKGNDPNVCIGRTNRVYCKDVHTCLIKEIIFEARNLIEEANKKNPMEVAETTFMYIGARIEMAKNLLEKFEIEQIDEPYWDEPNDKRQKHKNKKHK